MTQPRNRIRRAARWLYILGLSCCFILLVTGIIPLLSRGILSGYPLLLHTSAGLIFSMCLAALALMFAPKHAFAKTDWPWLAERGERPAGGGQLTRKIIFWVLLLLALPAILSIALNMFPLYGTHGQEIFLTVHRITAILLSVAVMVQACAIARAFAKPPKP